MGRRGMSGVLWWTRSRLDLGMGMRDDKSD
jgi:hypothetical protein